MTPVLVSVATVGVGALVRWLQEKKPLRSLIRKRRAAKGKGPLLDPKLVDNAVDAAAKFAGDQVNKKLGK